MKTYPALDVHWATASEDALDLLLADLDSTPPVALESDDAFARLFFESPNARDQAAALLAGRADISLTSTDISDEDWAARSQAALRAIQVGRLVVAPPWDVPTNTTDVVVIQPSMGFGTGHHATTRMCLRLLQNLDLDGKTVLDVGTGSGVLAIAAAKLGAASALGIDNDPDAIENARENIELNRMAGVVDVAHLALGIEHPASRIPHHASAGPPDVVLANLTGATLIRFAELLSRAMRPGGHLVVSGYLSTERDEVHAALQRQGLATVSLTAEDEWLASLWSSPTPSTTR